MITHPSVDEGNARLNFPRRYLKHEGGNTPRLNRRRLAMKRVSLTLLLLFSVPTAVMPQRYGRPYNLAAIPQLLLQVSVQKKTHYFSVYELRKMPRSVVAETDPTTNQTHVYEGVALETVASLATPSWERQSIEIEYGAHQTLTISGKDLDTQTKSIVVDTIDGRPLSGYAPYDLVAKFRGKPALTIFNVRSIRVSAS